MEAKLQTFKSPGRAEVQKLNFISLAAKVGRKCGSGNSIGRAEVRNGFHVTSLVVRPNGSAGADFQIFVSPVKLEVRKLNFNL